MRARLFTLVLVVLVAAGVPVAAVVVLLDGGGETADRGETQPAPSAAVVEAEAEAEEPPRLQEPALAAPAEPVTLRYDLLDITGAATAPGSYAFLKTAGDATSAIENFGNLPGRGVELRVHPTDASGASRAAFYDTVQVGDTFDYQDEWPRLRIPLQGDERRPGGNAANVRHRVRPHLWREVRIVPRGRSRCRQGRALRVEASPRSSRPRR